MPLAEMDVGLLLQVRVHVLELILEENRDQLTGELQALVTIVVAVVDEVVVVHGRDEPPDHEAKVPDLRPQVRLRAGHVREHLPKQDVHDVVARRPLLPVELSIFQLRDEEVQSTSLREYVLVVHLLKRRHQSVQVHSLDPNHLDQFHVALHTHGLHHDGNRYQLREGGVLEVDAGFSHGGVAAHHGSALVVCSRGCNEGLQVLLAVHFHDDAVGQRLFLHEEDALNPFNNEVAARIVWTLCKSLQFGLGLAIQHADVAAQHHRHPADLHVALADRLVAFPVADGDVDRRAVSEVPKPAHVRIGLGGAHVLPLARGPDGDTLIPQEPLRVGLAPDLDVAGSTHDLLQPLGHEVVVGGDVLGHQALVLQEEVHEPPLVGHRGRLLQAGVPVRGPLLLRPILAKPVAMLDQVRVVHRVILPLVLLVRPCLLYICPCSHHRSGSGQPVLRSAEASPRQPPIPRAGRVPAARACAIGGALRACVPSATPVRRGLRVSRA
mmetsp:Transcript_106961/g.345201  ORF Transcript_106961/g.345201 Transcript_106961/m.345201 type:complete len:495 (+) Transcript_106961:2339-3823(+)